VTSLACNEQQRVHTVWRHIHHAFQIAREALDNAPGGHGVTLEAGCAQGCMSRLLGEFISFRCGFQQADADIVLATLGDIERLQTVIIADHQIRVVSQKPFHVARMAMLGAHVQRRAMMTSRTADDIWVGSGGQQDVQTAGTLRDCRRVHRRPAPRVFAVDILGVLAAQQILQQFSVVPERSLMQQSAREILVDWRIVLHRGHCKMHTFQLIQQQDAD